jgi:uncharacterized protein YlxW (UPF0749 family)
MSSTNRYLCDILAEMRTTIKTLNFGMLLGLIEEVQTAGNRMEAALEDNRDASYLPADIRRLKREKKKLKKEIEELEEKLLTSE